MKKTWKYLMALGMSAALAVTPAMVALAEEEPEAYEEVEDEVIEESEDEVGEAVEVVEEEEEAPAAEAPAAEAPAPLAAGEPEGGKIKVTVSAFEFIPGDEEGTMAEYELTDYTVYVGLFVDDEYGTDKILVGDPEKIHFVDKKEESVEFTDVPDGTYYIYETDKDGELFELGDNYTVDDNLTLEEGETLPGEYDSFNYTVKTFETPNTVEIDLAAGKTEGEMKLVNTYYMFNELFPDDAEAPEEDPEEDPEDDPEDPEEDPEDDPEDPEDDPENDPDDATPDDEDGDDEVDPDDAEPGDDEVVPEETPEETPAPTEEPTPTEAPEATPTQAPAATATPAPTATPTNVPGAVKTGDNSPIALYAGLMAAALAGIGAVVLKKRSNK